MRLCAQCRYDLQGLPAGPCPECGQRFDPADDATFYIRTNWYERPWFTGLCVATVLLPLHCWLMLHLTWVVARLSLGYWPRPSLDDPKGIAVIGPLLWATLILIVLMPLALAGLWVLPMIALSRGRWMRAAVQLFAGVMLITIGIALLRWDPFDVAVWFMD